VIDAVRSRRAMSGGVIVGCLSSGKIVNFQVISGAPAPIFNLCVDVTILINSELVFYGKFD
jgi:hypothetical protein